MFSQAQLMSLTRDDEFQEWVKTDPVLVRLFSTPPESVDDRFTRLGLALGGGVDLGGILIDPPTVGTMLILGTIESPFVDSGKDMRLLDVDVAVWVLSQGRDALDDCARVADLEMLAAGVCDGIDLDRESARVTICELLAESFAAMEMIPSNNMMPDLKCHFDLAWATRTASRAAQMSGRTADYCTWRMSLTLANYYGLAWHVQQGGRIDRSRNDGEKVMARLREMMQEQISKKGYE